MKPQRIYLDSTLYDYLLNRITAEALGKTMRVIGLELVISPDNMQEWASCWKSGVPETIAKGKRLVAFALAITPRLFLTGIDDLIRREVLAVFKKYERGPFLPVEDIPQAEAVLERFADGSPTEQDLDQMFEHWEIKGAASARANEFLDEWADDPDHLPSLAAYLTKYPKALDIATDVYAERALGRRLGGRELAKLRRDRHKCRALTGAVHADCFVNWMTITGHALSHDRWDDLRHCVNSTYADVFVTGDVKLRGASKQIRPGSLVMSETELASLLRLT